MTEVLLASRAVTSPCWWRSGATSVVARGGCLLLALSLGCGADASSNGPKSAAATGSVVARGGLFRVGSVAYDEFFASVHDVQNEMKAVSDQRKSARGALAAALGVKPTEGPDLLLKGVREHVDDLQRWGIKVVVSGVMVHVEGGSTEKDISFSQGLTSCLANERDLAERMALMPERADSLVGLADVLEGSIEVDFAPAKRAQLKAEFDAARRVLQGIGGAARGEAKVSERFVEDLVMAATAGRGATKPKATPGKSTPPKTKGGS